MKVMIINAYSSRNAGDAAIMLSTVELIKSRGLQSVVIASRYHSEDRKYYADHGVRTVESAIDFPHRGQVGNVQRIVRFVMSSVLSFTLAVVARRTPQLASRIAAVLGEVGFVHLLQTDVVVIAGGG